mgnify:CR=1 FL=1
MVTALAAVLVVSGCATDSTRTGSINRNSKPIAEMNASELNSTINSYSQKYDRRPKDKKTGLRYADVLRTAGRDDQALAVMQQMVIYHPEDNDVLAAYGKALASKRRRNTIYRR